MLSFIIIHFLNISKSFNLVQHVTGPTHNRGHPLNFVFSLDTSLSSLNKIDSVPDHKCITFDTPLQPLTITQKRIFND